MPVTINGTTGIAGVDGSAGTPAVQGGDSNTGIFFPAADTIAFAEGGAEVARFDSSGNLGIGTSSPDDITSGYTTVDVRGSTGGGLRLGVAGGNNMAIYASGSTSVIEASGSSALQLVTNATERARIDSSGNLLVGASSLNGAGKVEISYDRASHWGLQIRNTTGTTQATTYLAFKYVNTQTGYIESSGSTTSYITTSDYRLKENVQPMTGALAKVALLKPCTYTWKSDGTPGQGFIAHELQEVCADAVSGEKDAVNEDGSIKPQGIDTSFLVATLTAAIQEQQALINDLTARIAALEAA